VIWSALDRGRNALPTFPMNDSEACVRIAVNTVSSLMTQLEAEHKSNVALQEEYLGASHDEYRCETCAFLEELRA